MAGAGPNGGFFQRSRPLCCVLPRTHRFDLPRGQVEVKQQLSASLLKLGHHACLPVAGCIPGPALRHMVMIESGTQRWALLRVPARTSSML